MTVDATVAAPVAGVPANPNLRKNFSSATSFAISAIASFGAAIKPARVNPPKVKPIPVFKLSFADCPTFLATSTALSTFFLSR